VLTVFVRIILGFVFFERDFYYRGADDLGCQCPAVASRGDQIRFCLVLSWIIVARDARSRRRWDSSFVIPEPDGQVDL